MSCVRAGPDGIYTFTYAVKGDELPLRVRGDWIERFSHAILGPTEP